MRCLTISLFLLSSTALAADTPPQPISIEMRGDVYMARKMYREAIDAYREAQKTSGDNSNDKAMLEDKVGIAWHQLGDVNAALKAYQRAIKLNPKYADAINNIGTIYYAQKHYRRAVNEYKKALTLTPTAAAIWSNLGTAQYSRHQFPQMAESYAKALELDPTVFDPRTGAGTQMQDRSVADRARYHFEMARIYAKAGRNELALQYLRKSLEEGYADKNKIVKAPEFAALHDTDEFRNLMALEPRVL